MSTEDPLPSDDENVSPEAAPVEDLEDPAVPDVPEVAAESFEEGASKPAFGPW